MKLSIGILLHILQICTSYFVPGFLQIFCQILVIFDHFVKQDADKSNVMNWGDDQLSATPPNDGLIDCQWNFPKFFYTYCRCAPPILFLGF